jgi:type II secretory pathway component PulC
VSPVARLAPLLVVLLTTLLAIAAAGATNAVLGRVVAPDEAPPEARPAATVAGAPPVATAATPRGVSGPTLLDGIRRRNIFDPAYITAYNPAARGEGGGVPLSDLKLKLLATFVAVPDTHSAAIIAGDNGSSGFGKDEELFSTGATLVGIERDRVKIRTATGEESYLLLDDAAPIPSAEPSGAATASTTEGVEQLSETKFAIDKAVFDKFLSDPTQLATMGRALLHRGPDGEYDGYRLSAIRRGTIADSLGIKNGDVVHSINGKPLNSVQAAMSAGTDLTGGASGPIAIEVTRRGQKMTLEYEVR